MKMKMINRTTPIPSKPTSWYELLNIQKIEIIKRLWFSTNKWEFRDTIKLLMRLNPTHDEIMRYTLFTYFNFDFYCYEDFLKSRQLETTNEVFQYFVHHSNLTPRQADAISLCGLYKIKMEEQMFNNTLYLDAEYFALPFQTLHFYMSLNVVRSIAKRLDAKLNNAYYKQSFSISKQFLSDWFKYEKTVMTYGTPRLQFFSKVLGKHLPDSPTSVSHTR